MRLASHAPVNQRRPDPTSNLRRSTRPVSIFSAQTRRSYKLACWFICESTVTVRCVCGDNFGVQLQTSTSTMWDLRAPKS